MNRILCDTHLPVPHVISDDFSNFEVGIFTSYVPRDLAVSENSHGNLKSVSWDVFGHTDSIRSF